MLSRDWVEPVAKFKISSLNPSMLVPVVWARVLISANDVPKSPALLTAKAIPPAAIPASAVSIAIMLSPMFARGDAKLSTWPVKP